MNIFTVCPCCSNRMLRHINHDSIYWFCRSCWQEMPDFSTNRSIKEQIELLDRKSSQLNLQQSTTLV